jgi:glycosyltransferase involved in cell wall biosynthesis
MAAAKNKTEVAFAVTNCICHDQRVLKIAETVSRLNCDITLIGKWSGSCCKSGSVPFRTKRFRMLFKKGFLFYKFFNIRLFLWLLFHRCDIIVSNDLDTLPACFLVSKIVRMLIVFDSHEYFTGVPELQDRPFVKWVWKSFERAIVPHLKYVMTVSDSIANQYQSEYDLKPFTVRNCSINSYSIIPWSKEELGFRKEDLLLILQGTGINKERGGEELIEAINRIKNVSLAVVGSGDLIGKLKDDVIRLGLSDRIKFFPKVPWKEMMRFTKSADAGLSLDKNTNINHTFSLPNKVFDYISAGIPVIAGDLPEVGNIISQNKCGIIIPFVTPEEISKAIIKLKENPELLVELKKNAAIASNSINWETESRKVIEIYSQLIRDLKNGRVQV